jgi:UDP-N-acetyl-D-galactosamine dehydrogenase
MNPQNINLGIMGLGYVGLPLAVEFGKKIPVTGFDINKKRILELQSGVDSTLEVDDDQLKSSTLLTFTDEINILKSCNIIIVTVPTPVNNLNEPDFAPLISACNIVASVINLGDIIVFESTVYPGATEEICVPVIEECSNLKLNKDFFVGYSPERINPGDKKHRLKDITKLVSASNDDTLGVLNNLYSKIISAGTFPVSSIKVAEAAKVIENTQRDVNIALMNELSIIFSKLNIDTEEVLKAAETKWNFLPFRPGLVGGHCIGVDPYYLTFKAKKSGYKPEIILSGRKLNDNMSHNVTDRFISSMESKKIILKDSNILIMGLTFKENCPDTRNSKVFDLIDNLKSYKMNVDVLDPWVCKKKIKKTNFNFVDSLKENYYDGIILAVAHKDFLELSAASLKSSCKETHIIFDLKYILEKEDSDLRM